MSVKVDRHSLYSSKTCYLFSGIKICIVCSVETKEAQAKVVLEDLALFCRDVAIHQRDNEITEIH